MRSVVLSAGSDEAEPAAAVLVMRDAASELAEGWRRALRCGSGDSFEEWARGQAGQAAPRWRYDRVTADWVARLGADRVTLVLADESDEAALVDTEVARHGVAEARRNPVDHEEPALRPVPAALADRFVREASALSLRGWTGPRLVAATLSAFDLSGLADAVCEPVRSWVEGLAATTERTGARIVGDVGRLRLPVATSGATGDAVALADAVGLATQVLSALERSGDREDLVRRLAERREELDRASSELEQHAAGSGREVLRTLLSRATPTGRRS